MEFEFERVEITYFKTPYAFWINRLDDEDLEYKKFYKDLQTHCAGAPGCVVRIGKIYGVKDPKLNMWVRAEFDREIDVNLANKLHSNIESYKVWLVDEGRPAEITLPARRLSSTFREKGSKCERAMLFGVTPATCQINHSTGQFEKEKTNTWNANAAALVNKLLNRTGNEVWFRERKKLENCVLGDLIIKHGIDEQVNIATYLSEKHVAYLDNLKENEEIRLPSVCRLATPIEKDLESNSPIEKILESKSQEIVSKSDAPRQRIRALTTRNIHLKTEDAISRVKSSAVLTRTMGRGSRRSLNTSSDSESIHDDSRPKALKPLNKCVTSSSDSTSESFASIQSEPKQAKPSVKSVTEEVAVLDLNRPFIEDDASFLQRMAHKAKLKKLEDECKVEPVNIKPETAAIKSKAFNEAGSQQNNQKEQVKEQKEIGLKLGTENKIVSPQRKTKAGLLMKKLKIKPKKIDEDTFFTADESNDTTASESSVNMSSSSVKDGLTGDISDSSDLKSEKENNFAWPVMESKSKRKQPLMIPAGLPPNSDHYKKLIENHEENKLEKAAVRKHNQSKEYSSNNSEDSSSDDLLKNNIRTLQEGRNIKSGSGMSVLKYGQTSNKYCPKLLIHSMKKITPIQNISQAYLHPDIQSTLTYMNFMELTNIQSYVWPAINRGENVVAVSRRVIKPPRTYDHKACMIYLPVLCNIIIQNNYEDLVNIDSPFALILCAHKTAARVVFKQVTELLRTTSVREKIDRDRTRRDGRNNKNKSKSRVHLLLDAAKVGYGCDIVISTPKCFKAAIDGMGGLATDLRKLCHLVIDDVDIITERNFDELHGILKLCHKMLTRRHNEQRSIQLILTAEKWNSGIEDLCFKTPVKPAICIESHIEAAIYAKVNMNLQFIQSTSKVEVLYDLIDKKFSKYKTIVMCNKFIEIDDIVEMLVAKGIDVLPLPKKLSGTQIKEIFQIWNGASPGAYQLLVLSDDVLPDINISSAMWLIHYNLPRTWTHFSNRFYTLHDNYQSTFATIDKKLPAPKVHIFIDETHLEVIPRMVNFLERMKKLDPKSEELLHKLKEQAVEKKELRKIATKTPTSICDSMLTMGTCHFQQKCKQRHIFFKQTDYPKFNIPINSEIKLHLVEFFDAVHFSARLTNTDNESYKTLALDMSQYYRTHDIESSIIEDIEIGELYAYQKTKTLYERCKVLEIRTEYSKEYLYKILLLDTSERKVVKIAQLRELPDEFKAPSPLALEVIIANLRPHDDELLWDTNGRQQIEHLLSNIEIHKPNISIMGVVKMVIDKIVWLDNVRVVEYFDNTQNEVVKLHLENELIRAKIAMKNGAHMAMLKKLCDKAGITHEYADIVMAKSSSLGGSKDFQFYEVQRAFLEIEGGFDKVYFLAASDVGAKFYVGRCAFNDLLSSLLDQIKKALQDPFYPSKLDIVENMYCLAYMQQYELYYRVQVKKALENDQYTCFLIDEGYEEIFDAKSLKPALNWMLEKLPAQSIPCRLYGVHYDASGLEQYEDDTTLWARCMKRDSDGLYAILLMREGVEKNIAINSIILQEIGSKPIKSEEFTETDFILDVYDDEADSEEEEEEPVEKIFTKSNSQSAPDAADDKLEDQFGPIEYGSDGEERWDVQMDDFKEKLEDILNPKKTTLPELPASSSPLKEVGGKMVEMDEEAVAMHSTHTLMPTVFWHQTNEDVVLKIQLAGIKEYEISFTQQSMLFSAIYASKAYELNIKFYEQIIAENVKHEAKGLEIVVKLQKLIQDKNWPRLLNSKERYRNIKLDLDKELSSDEDEKKKKPFLSRLGELKDILDDSSDSDVDGYHYDFGSEDDSSDVISSDSN